LWAAPALLRGPLGSVVVASGGKTTTVCPGAAGNTDGVSRWHLDIMGAVRSEMLAAARSAWSRAAGTSLEKGLMGLGERIDSFGNIGKACSSGP